MSQPLLHTSTNTPILTLTTTTYVGMAGISIVSVCGVLQFWKRWTIVGRSWIRGTEKTISAKDSELASLRQTLSSTKDDIQQKETKLSLLAQELEGVQKRAAELEKQLAAARTQNQALGDRVSTLGKETQRLSAELQHVRVEHIQTLDLLQTRTAELKGSQAFLTKADQLSNADVIKMIEGLNSEILQTAAIMAEAFTFDKTQTPRADGETEEGPAEAEVSDARSRSAEILGSRLVDLLRSSDHQEDPIVVQVALQTSMSAYTHWIISSWYFDDPDDEHLLSEIYARVRESEEQAVSGRWRALTRTHVQRMMTQVPDLAIYIVDAFKDVLLAAGVQLHADSLHARISKEFSQRISLVISAARQLNKIIGADITSCDLEALYIAPDVQFMPSSMQDSFSDGSGKIEAETDQETILCTTDLGLVRAEKKSGQIGEWHEAVLLKPKVVLPSGLQDITGGVVAL